MGDSLSEEVARVNVGAMVKQAPNWVLAACGTLIVVALIAAFTVLSLAGRPTDDLRSMIMLGVQFLGAAGGVAGIGAFIASSAAAKSSAAVEDQIVPKDEEVPK
jgi:hypothetical protein